MGNLVVIKDNDTFTTSIEIAKGVEHSHTSVLRLIKSSMDLEIFMTLKVNKIGTKGRASEVFYLSEEQATLLIALMRNTSIVRQFKHTLVKEFYRQRKLLNQIALRNGNDEWLLKRQESKVMRKECTDVIQKFVKYAKEQGSQSADKYYMNFSRMELTGLFMMEQKYPNAREVMSMRQLNLIEMADEAIANVIQEEMSKKTPYKEIYLRAKEKIELLAKIFPPSPLPMLLEKDKPTI